MLPRQVAMEIAKVQGEAKKISHLHFNLFVNKTCYKKWSTQKRSKFNKKKFFNTIVMLETKQLANSFKSSNVLDFCLRKRFNDFWSLHC